MSYPVVRTNIYKKNLQCWEILGNEREKENQKKRFMGREANTFFNDFLRLLKSNDKNSVKWNLINDKKKTWEEVLL